MHLDVSAPVQYDLYIGRGNSCILRIVHFYHNNYFLYDAITEISMVNESDKGNKVICLFKYFKDFTCEFFAW
jgi:hypothetical protein